jgi:hypothetical protein
VSHCCSHGHCITSLQVVRPSWSSWSSRHWVIMVITSLRSLGRCSYWVVTVVRLSWSLGHCGHGHYVITVVVVVVRLLQSWSSCHHSHSHSCWVIAVVVIRSLQSLGHCGCSHHIVMSWLQLSHHRTLMSPGSSSDTLCGVTVYTRGQLSTRRDKGGEQSS